MNPMIHEDEADAIGPDDLVLADALEQILDQMGRGERIDVPALFPHAPQLIPQAEEAVAGLQMMLDVAAAMQAQSQLLSSAILAQQEEDSSKSARRTEHNPDPFPDRYRVIRSLGQGAFGTVWLADDLTLGRQVALKTIRLEGAPLENADLLRRLREEARTLASLRHRNIVRIYDFLEAPGESSTEAVFYLVLEYVPGGSLKERVTREGPLPWERAARYIADVAEALLQIHRAGIVHRDVKPGNILWNPDADEAMLTDFGIATRLARDTMIAGTPFYMPPEAFAGSVGFGQDVFGLSATLFYLVTGSVPFPGPTTPAFLAQVRAGLAKSDPRLAELPAELEDLICSGLHADPDRRPTLADFVRVLRGSLNQLLTDTIAYQMPSSPASGLLRLTVSKEVGPSAFVPVACSQPPAERRLRDIKRVPPRPERVEVHTGERLRIEVETGQPGYVTVFNVGPTGNLNLLYPIDPASPPARVEPGRPLHVIDVELSPPAGRERLIALWTDAPTSLRLDEIQRLAEAGDLEVSEPYRATRDIVRVQQKLEQMSPASRRAVVVEVDHVSATE